MEKSKEETKLCYTMLLCYTICIEIKEMVLVLTNQVVAIRFIELYESTFDMHYGMVGNG
jgi:hypothetical protein